MFAINHTTKRIQIYKLQAMCAADTCCYPDCHAPNTGYRTCDEHSEYKVFVWSEDRGFAICDHCGISAMRNGRCRMCLRFSPTRGDIMDVAEMIDATIDRGGGGAQIVEMLVDHGHMPPDANTRPAQQTAQEIKALYAARQFFIESGLG